MDDEYIRRKSIEKIMSDALIDRRFATGYDYAILTDIISDLPAADVQPVTHTENMSTVAFCDRFICKNCDLHLEDWVKVVIDPDDGDELHYEYEFKFCPECGAKIVEEGKK